MLKIEDVTLRFFHGTVNEKTALDQISLHIPKGEFVTVIGGNGAGKSSLLQLVAGTCLPDQGKISLSGQDLLSMPEHRRASLLGRVFQDPMQGTASDLTLEENLALAGRRGEKHRYRRALSGEDRQRFRQILSRLELGLEDRLTVKVGLLSGGQRQALTLLMAVMKEPQLLLLDEHTAALDPKTAATVMKITEEFVKNSQFSTLMITHNMRDAIRYGDRLIMMSCGKIILDVKDEAKRNLTVEQLLKEFEKNIGFPSF